MPGPARGLDKNWTWDGKLYHVPHVWGTEAISWRNDLTKIEPEELSFGTLWNDEYKGKVQGRPHSLLLGIGLWLDGTGKLPSNRMLDAFKDEATFKKIYDQILHVRHRPQALDQAVLGFRRQHQVRLQDQRRRDRPDLGRPGDLA